MTTFQGKEAYEVLLRLLGVCLKLKKRILACPVICCACNLHTLFLCVSFNLSVKLNIPDKTTHPCIETTSLTCSLVCNSMLHCNIQFDVKKVQQFFSYKLKS